jgi:peptidylprolyl isomerase
MANKKEYATRFGMGILALLFLVTSAGFSILVIWQSRNQKKQEAQTASVQSANKSSNTIGANKMQGTQLANFTTVSDVPTLISTDVVVGTGEEVKPGDTVTAHYTGAVAATGVIFQSSHDGPNQPVAFPLANVIKGWTDGVPGMKVGGTRRLVIPADQAYGANPPGGSGIPANAPLVFDIELTKIGK